MSEEEIGFIKRKLEEHEKRISEIESRLINIESKSHQAVSENKVTFQEESSNIKKLFEGLEMPEENIKEIFDFNLKESKITLNKIPRGKILKKRHKRHRW
jgi:hypothetical protein